MRRLLSVFLLSAILPGVAIADDLLIVNRIVDEGFNHSELPETASHLTDRIGGRLTNSPQMREAERWTQQRYRDWGLKNVHADGFEFGRGWSIERSSVRLLTPRAIQYRAIPIAWTPATQGALNAPVIVAPMVRDRDFDKWRGQLRGKIVLVTRPDTGSEPAEPAFKRIAGDELAGLDTYEQPRGVVTPTALAKRVRQATFDARRDAFLAAEGAVAWARKARRDGGLVQGEGYGYQVGQTARLPGVELAAEDYRQIARLYVSGLAPTLEINSAVRFHDEDSKAYNIIADIPGRDAKAGYVMAGAHLDSWVASDGAQDNAAGSAVIMEAARILSTLGVKPKRTIRFALWSGEEQGILGSLDYVEKHLASRPPETNPDLKTVNPYYTWDARWPITPGPGYRALSAYFNLDNGSGKIRGIHTEGNIAVVPIFQQWLAPFASMGATQVAAAPTGGTDHVVMQAVGIPGFQFIQDPLDYDSRIHHTSLDSYDHLRIEDMKQAAVILATMLLRAADSDEPLPRMPLPRTPKATDPFAIEDDAD
ncbi:M20/M25/M40 family metallo-hydrolase [Luteimonas sp. RIT-PG2_3]